MFIGLYNIQHRSLGRDARRNLVEVIHVSGGVIYYIELLVSGAQKHKPPPPKGRSLNDILLIRTYTYILVLIRFFVQDGGDGDSASSDGIFVYQGSAPSVALGDVVVVSGKASEYYSNTQITVNSVPTDIVSVCQGHKTQARPLNAIIKYLYKRFRGQTICS